MNIKIENNKQLILFLSSVGFVVITLSVFILFAFSNNNSNKNTNQTESSVSSISSSIVSSGPEQIPERITDFYSALPFMSSEFSVEYNKANNQIIVTSTKYSQTELPPIFKNWINRFPNLKINSLKIKYVGSEANIIDKITGK